MIRTTHAFVLAFGLLLPGFLLQSEAHALLKKPPMRAPVRNPAAAAPGANRGAPMGAQAGANSQEVNGRVEDFERYLESRIKDALATILNGRKRPVVAVRAIQDAKAREGGGQALDVGYVPMPLVVDPGAVMDAPASVGKPIDKLKIVGVEVDLVFSDQPEPSVLAASKDLVAKLLLKYHPMIKVTSASIPPEAEKEQKPVDPLKPEAGLKIGEALPSIAAVLVALILALGLYEFSRSFRASADTLAKGMSAFNPLEGMNAGGGAGDGEKAMADSGSEEDDEEEEAPKTSFAPSIYDDSQYLKVIREVLAQDPSAVSRSVTERAEDQQGLRQLFPLLTEKEHSLLAGAIGEERVSRLAEVESDFELSARDFSTWLRLFAERAVLRKIQGGSEVEKALGAQLTLKIMAFRPERLLEAARRENSRASWRIAADFVPKSEFAQSITKLDQAQIKPLIEGGEARPEELVDTAQKLVKGLEASAGTEGDRLERRSRYFASHLVGPVATAVSALTPGEDDKFLDDLARTSPDLVVMVRKAVWTPKMMAGVPDAYLRKIMRELSNEERCHLVIALPEAQSARIRQAVPAGSSQQIVEDMVRQARQADNPELKREAGEFARSFLDRLRKESQAGLLTLVKSNGETAA